MSPRPRKVSDDRVLLATIRAMQRRSPPELTLADIAAEAGLTPGALVQRFGSKRGLLLRLAALWAEGVGDLFTALRARHPSPLAAVKAWADGMAGMAQTPEMLANSFGYLLMDLTDPEFYRHTVAGARATRRELRQLVAEALARGELRSPDRRPTDPAGLARALEVTVSGSLLTWAIHRTGTARAAVRRDLAVTLRPWLGPAGRPAGRAGGPA